MPFVPRAPRAWAPLLAACGLAACGSDPVAPPPTTTVRITTTTTGADPDQGYVLNVSGGLQNYTTRHPIAAAGTLVLERTATDRELVYVIHLDDVAPNCGVESANPVTLRLTGRQAADVAFAVTCEAFGRLEVRVLPADVDLGEQLLVHVSGGTTVPPLAVAERGPVATFPTLAAGEYAVTVRGVPLNCHVDGQARTASVSSAGTTSIQIELACGPHGRIAFARASGSDASSTDIFTISTSGTDLRQLTTDPGAERDPVWSPDGSRIAFTRVVDGTPDVFVMNADGSGAQRLTTGPASDTDPTWSPDGRRIAFVSDRSGLPHIHVMNADGSGVVALTAGDVVQRDPAWSPDGTRIAFVGPPLGAGLQVMNADGSGTVMLTGTGELESEPAWSPDGSRLAFLQNGFVYVIDADGSNMGRVELQSGYDAQGSPTWSPDGRRVAFTNSECDFYGYYCSISFVAVGMEVLDRWEILDHAVLDPSWRW